MELASVDGIGQSDRRAVEHFNSDPSRSYAHGGVQAPKIVGDLSYKMTGLLCLQTLFTIVLKENSHLKAYVYRLESRRSSASEDLQKPRSTSFMTVDDPRNCDSLLSDKYSNMQVYIAKLEQILHDIEGTSAQGLIQRALELQETTDHQTTVIDDLKRKVAMYEKYEGSLSESAGPRQPSELIDELLADKKQLSFQRTLVAEMGKQLEKKTIEAENLHQQLEFERCSRKQSQTQLIGVLTDLLLRCLENPDPAKETELETLYRDIETRSRDMIHEFREGLTAAVQIASEEGRRFDFLREHAMKVIQLPESSRVESLSVSAQDVISKLQDRFYQLVRDAKASLMEQMKKTKLALLKVKDTEEKLMKSDADKRIVQEKLSGEIRKLKGNWDHFEQSLGSRSSYAIKASQSVRAFVELIEEQKLELESQVRIMKANVESLQTKVHSLEQSKAQLKNEIEQLQTDIKEKVTVAAGAELKALRLQCNALQNESKTAKERCQLLEEQNKREQEARRSVEEQLLKEKSQIERYKAEVKVYKAEVEEYRATNVSLLQSKHDLSAQIADLRTELLRLENRGPSQQLDDPQQRVYIGRDIFRSEHNNLLSEHSISSSSQSMTPTPLSSFNKANQSRAVPHDSLSVSGVTSTARIEPTSSLPLYHTLGDSSTGTGTKMTGTDSGKPHSFIGRQRNSLYSRGVQAQHRDTMKCLKCGEQYPITNLDSYEKHIRDCYSELQ